MRRSFWIFFALLSAMVIAGWRERSSQQRTTRDLQAEVSRRKEPPPELKQVLTENFRLARLQISPSETKQLEDDQAAAVRLRAEVMDVSRTLSARAKSARGSMVSPWMWMNAGTQLPSATAETVLWAAAAGDIETLVGLLQFTPEARAGAEVLFAELPEAVRAEYKSPEHLVATLAAKDVPLTPVAISPVTGGPDKMKVSLLFVDLSDPRPYRTVTLSMVPTGKGWRLLVPVEAVEKYAALLKVAAPPSAKK